MDRSISLLQGLKEVQRQQVFHPREINLIPTNACNLNCWFCHTRNTEFLDREHYQKKDKICPVQMDLIINDLIKLQVNEVNLTGGGEPLAYDYITQTINQLHDANIRIRLTTNGTLLKAPLLGQIASKINTVVINLGSSPKKNPERYALIKENLESMYELYKTPKIEVEILLEEDVISQLFTIAKDFKYLGAQKLTLRQCLVGDSKKNAQYYRSFEDILYREKERIKEIEDFGFKVAFLDETLKTSNDCYLVHNSLTIGADLGLYNCLDSLYCSDNRLITINNMPLSSFLETKDAIKKIKRVRNKDLCNIQCSQKAKNHAIETLLREIG